MTDRIRSVHITLEQDERVGTDERANLIMDALRMIRGVATVEAGPVVGYDQLMARDTARRDLQKELWEVLKK